MAKKNIGILLLGFLVVVGIIGISVFFMKKGGSEPEQEMSQSIGTEPIDVEMKKRSEEVMKKKGKPTGSSGVEIEFLDGFSMDKLNMTIDELNQLKTYKIKLCADLENYMDRAAGVLLEDVVSADIKEDPEVEKGTGLRADYIASDGSEISGSARLMHYTREPVPEEKKSTDYEKEVNSYMEALEVGFPGEDEVTYSVVDVPEALQPEDPNDATYCIQHYIDGYPLTGAIDYAYEADDEGYRYSGGDLGLHFFFHNGWLTGADLAPQREIYKTQRITPQYESMDQFCEQLEEKLKENRGASGGGGDYDYYEISDVRCCYVIGETKDVKENGLKEMIAVPFLEFKAVNYHYYAVTETWVSDALYTIGYNLQNGVVSPGRFLN